MIAAATEYHDNSEYDYPCAVIIKDVAKAVVVHIMFFLRSLFFELCALDTIVCFKEKEVHKVRTPLKII